MPPFKVQEKINDEITIHKEITLYIKVIYPDGKYIFLSIPDVRNMPKIGQPFNAVYIYESIEVDGLDETGMLFGQIKLGYRLKQITYQGE